MIVKKTSAKDNVVALEKKSKEMSIRNAICKMHKLFNKDIKEIIKLELLREYLFNHL